MNILFSTIFYVSPTQGGTERVTYSVASSLKNLGHSVYSMYSSGDDNGDSNTLFSESYRIPDIKDTTNLSIFLKSRRIDAVIIQGAYVQVKWFRQALKKMPFCKLLFVHHFEPAWELHEFTFLSYWRNFKNTTTLKSVISMLGHMVLYPIERRRYERQLPLWYREAYDYADKIILLTKGFISQYMEYAGIMDDVKFTIIPNMLSFDHFETKDRILEKQKLVLIVSRMSEPQKRISLALNIWNECMKDKTVADWKLYVVGIGEDLENYHELVKRKHIPNVTFWGRQNPLLFYQVASIFMMTSSSEAWGLTLTESMQNGVVPLAFDTYAALRDIITDDSVGYAITEGNTDEYISKLKHLMKDTDNRHRMALNGIESAKRFTSQKIGAVWNELLSD